MPVVSFENSYKKYSGRLSTAKLQKGYKSMQEVVWWTRPQIN